MAEHAWLDAAIGRIRAAGARKVFVQAPEGLKTRLQGIGSALENAGIEAVLSCEPCYGACDLRDAEAKRHGCELLLHIGHRDSGVKASLPVIYEEYPMEADAAGMLRPHSSKLESYATIGLATTVQYLKAAEDAARFLESKGRNVLVCKRPILGCDQTPAKAIEDKVDAFLFIGTGSFHALGLAAAVSKPVLFLDLESGSITDMKEDKEMQERIRLASIEKAKGCENFGILVSTKPGQAGLKAAEAAKAGLESKGKSAWLLAMDTITPEKLMGLKLDCLVNCACPRLSEDAAQFRKPVIRPEDVERL